MSLRRFSSYRFENQAIALGGLSVDARFEVFACETNSYLWQYFILDRSWDRNSVSGVPVFALVEFAVKNGKLRVNDDNAKEWIDADLNNILRETISMVLPRLSKRTNTIKPECSSLDYSVYPQLGGAACH
ncbi:hypothetical protein [Agarivorans gilvus]|uniref:Uncharacterized protein n=1 Tax=Agarivorans gilvus TaxID=680279 RepID=A0ABQ1I8A3_9ALTE|nr:hypothetical protein [Agarivorans gilvus]GGB21168.1 hypothetical protein GCM10007414_38200 [Agarivorans gilvus]